MLSGEELTGERVVVAEIFGGEGRGLGAFLEAERRDEAITMINEHNHNQPIHSPTNTYLIHNQQRDSQSQ